MKRTLILFFIIITTLLTSCLSYLYYTPSPHQVPMFKEKGEFSMQGTVNSNGLLDGQAAYAITDHIAVMGGAALNVSKPFPTIDHGFGAHLNLAAGYFAPLFNGNTIFSIYGGMERGEYDFEYTILDKRAQFGWLYYSTYKDNGTAHIASNKFHLTPSVGYTHRIFDIAFSMRMAHLSFPTIENNIIEQNSYAYRDLERLKDFNNSILFEPAITYRMGWEYFKVQTQIGWSFNARHFTPGYFDEMFFSVGLYFILTKRYEKEFIP